MVKKNLEVLSSSKTLITTYKPTWHHNAENHDQTLKLVFLNWCAMTFRIHNCFYKFINSWQGVVTAVRSSSVLHWHLISICCSFFVKFIATLILFTFRYICYIVCLIRIQFLDTFVTKLQKVPIIFAMSVCHLSQVTTWKLSNKCSLNLILRRFT